ncbi:MAG: glycosyltransferase family 2 protein [Paludisphaera borealis]|uniref:glycosyltransferase family 2 protein n=1 Tax=Paludisphaera borealis TaxID=1387353 RepID=UPI0028436195|nr:glycosyltransferase family 2 protein [Paludisphaera borealis]MDR3622501.1 glycosyltransferase family 2 protein [Paludisphaera borealis]
MEALTIAVLLFWACAALIFYAYLGYPIVIWALSRVFGRPPTPPAGDDGEWPLVSLLIPAFNEEVVLGDRLQNAVAMDYPVGKLEIVVGSDGSTDATAAIARAYAGRGVRLMEYDLRRGKATILNESMPELSGEIVLMSDANTLIDPAALRKLVRWFRDPTVGAVCGRLLLIDPAEGRNVDGLYWKYETFIKQCENRLGALLGANGGIYAIRKALYSPIPATTTVDDLVIPLRAKLETGCRIVYEADAIAREETAPDINGEFRRRARNGTGDLRSLEILWPLLNPIWGWTTFTFFSHKILRLACPFLLLILLGCSLLLSDRPLYQAALIGQVGFYLVSVLAGHLPPRPWAFRFLRLTTMFVGMNLALMVGFWRWIWGTQKGTWRPTGRHGQRA